MINESVAKKDLSCSHCGTMIRTRPITSNQSDEVFCCNGCRTVFGILQSRGLQNYYSLKKSDPLWGKAGPAHSLVGNPFGYLNDPEFIRLYSTHQGTQMKFYVEGVHCAACVWVLEKAPQFVPSVKSVHLDLGKNIATVELHQAQGFTEVATEFNLLGYLPHPIQEGEHAELQRKENRKFLMRIAVAGACTGNIMLLAISVYAGALGILPTLFGWISFALFLPVAFFSTTPFYLSAWSALKTKTISIDVPIALGVALGGFASLVNLLSGQPSQIYFDSLSSFVFLLLSTRYFLNRAQQSALVSTDLQRFLTPSIARKQIAPHHFEEQSISAIQPGDRVEVKPGDIIPVDGFVVQGASTLNLSLLTGESNPISIGVGDKVFSGTANLNSPLIIEVTASGAKTRLGQIIKDAETSLRSKPAIVDLTNKIAKYFVLATLVFAFGAFLLNLLNHGFSQWNHGLNLALAMIVVTCPCAFALATPLALIRALGLAAQEGILIKNSEVLEKLVRAKKLFVDKTGTLTYGDYEVKSWMCETEHQDTLPCVIFAMENKSNHPVAKALVRYFEKLPRQSVLIDQFTENLGRGVSAYFKNQFYEIRSLQTTTGKETETAVGVFVDHKLVSTLLLGDQVRPDSKKFIDQIKVYGLDPILLTGDRESTAKEVARLTGISSQNIIASATPETKQQLLKTHSDAIMIGDGANDAPALAAANVGFAIRGGMEMSLRVADIYVRSPGVQPVARTLEIAHETFNVIRRNLVFSIGYNILGITAVCLGVLSPLFAAILMPVSALTVFASSIYGTSRMRRSKL